MQQLIGTALCQARSLMVRGDDEAAKYAYLEVLRLDPVHCGALTELGALAHSSGHLSAAREAYARAVRYHPDSPAALVGYAHLLNEAGDAAAARLHFQAALVYSPDMREAHQGLARVLAEMGEHADWHWQQGFGGHAVIRPRYRGRGTGIPLLLLVAAIGGNIPTHHWIDDRIFAVTAVYADYHDPADPIPPPLLSPRAAPGYAGPDYAAIVNAIGDADLCATALANADRITNIHSAAATINAPAMVATTGRETNAQRLGAIPNVLAPRTQRLSRASTLCFPLLLRASGYHTGQHFLLVETPDGLPRAVTSLPPGDPLAIEYLDARGPDGMARKYRVMFIGGALYPLHLAISADWKVHYFTADMAANPAFRTEERRFLEHMATVLGEPAMIALTTIEATLGLDYAGIDFALDRNGALLLFEANATMAIIPPDADPIWDYRRPAVTAALAAARHLLPQPPWIGHSA